MKTKIGIVFMILGSMLIVSALGLFIHNTYLQNQAVESVDKIMPQIVDSINEQQGFSTEETDVSDPQIEVNPSEYEVPDLLIKEMSVVEIDGYGYIGFLSIPNLGLELPVMADWSYPQLKISPCRFAGNMYNDDLVIMAHNYARHFRSLKNLRVGDVVSFTDMDGVTTQYTVVVMDILAPEAVEEMTAGDYDLTMFTCTYGGKSRITVRCERTES